MTIKLFAAAVAATLALASVAASAHDYYWEHHVSATAVCQPSTPLQLGGLRQRPLGIFNNKPEAIYISCSFHTDPLGEIGKDRLEISFYNGTAAAVEIACTAQGGSRTVGVNNYTGSVVVPAGASAPLVFDQIHRRREAGSHINLSCLLPGGVEMGRISVRQDSRANLPQ
ncbi:hypothetical protein [Lysobacter sp. A3-1-A15]|uniref:hypothetical protein n=1 Tax=Novilysobacter viscosus TaxID=3098602 RepID=UPI002ED790CE